MRDGVIEESVQLCCLSSSFAVHWHKFSLLTQVSMRALVPSILLPSERAALSLEEELRSNARRSSLVKSTLAPQATQSRFQHHALLALDNTRMQVAIHVVLCRENSATACTGCNTGRDVGALLQLPVSSPGCHVFPGGRNPLSTGKLGVSFLTMPWPSSKPSSTTHSCPLRSNVATETNWALPLKDSIWSIELLHERNIQKSSSAGLLQMIPVKMSRSCSLELPSSSGPRASLCALAHCLKRAVRTLPDKLLIDFLHRGRWRSSLGIMINALRFREHVFELGLTVAIRTRCCNSTESWPSFMQIVSSKRCSHRGFVQRLSPQSNSTAPRWASHW